MLFSEMDNNNNNNEFCRLFAQNLRKFQSQFGIRQTLRHQNCLHLVLIL